MSRAWSRACQENGPCLGSKMESRQFLGADGQSWWLYEVQTDRRIEEARAELGLALGWTETEWFADPLRRQALLEFLQTTRPEGPELLVNLDTVADDEARLQWVSGLKKLALPTEQPVDEVQPAEAVTSSPAPAPAKEKAAPATAPAKKSIFKTKAASDAAAATGSGASATTVANGTPGTAQLEDATKAVLSDLGGGGLADLAQELGVEPGDLEAIVKDPDFERQVREEVARLVGA
jgi:hypothetical protein